MFFIEPLADDEDWGDYLTQEARAVSHWKKLLGMIRVGKRWKRASNTTSSTPNRLQRVNRWIMPQPAFCRRRGGNSPNG